MNRWIGKSANVISNRLHPPNPLTLREGGNIPRV